MIDLIFYFVIFIGFIVVLVRSAMFTIDNNPTSSKYYNQSGAKLDDQICFIQCSYNDKYDYYKMVSRDPKIYLLR